MLCKFDLVYIQQPEVVQSINFVRFCERVSSLLGLLHLAHVATFGA